MWETRSRVTTTSSSISMALYGRDSTKLQTAERSPLINFISYYLHNSVNALKA